MNDSHNDATPSRGNDRMFSLQNATPGQPECPPTAESGGIEGSQPTTSSATGKCSAMGACCIFRYLHFANESVQQCNERRRSISTAEPKDPNTHSVQSTAADGKRGSQDAFVAATAADHRGDGLEQYWEAGTAGFLPKSGMMLRSNY